MLLRAQPILAVKALAAWGQRPVRLRLDAKKLPAAALGRACRAALPGRVGRDHANGVPSYGLRPHARVDDEGWLRRVLVRPATEHDVRVALGSTDDVTGW